jgi:hypothetical protein
MSMNELQHFRDHNLNLEPDVARQIEQSVRPMFDADSKLPYMPKGVTS